MKANTSVFAAFAVGAILASLPYTLANRTTMAQGAGPNQQGQGQPGLPGPGGFGQGQFFQGRVGQPGVTSMTTSGGYLFAASGDSIYKIKIDTMKIEGETKLPRPQFQPGIGNGGGGFGGGQGRRGNGGGGQQNPPSEKK